MANRQIYPSSLFPLQGDLSAVAGATSVEVVGLQDIPIAANPLTDGAVPTYVAINNDIEWKVPTTGGDAVHINGIAVSADFLVLLNTAFTINYGSDTFLGFRINGTRDGG